MKWQGDMSLEQVDMVERTFATFTESGWVVPAWVQSLRAKVMLYNMVQPCFPMNPRNMDYYHRGNALYQFQRDRWVNVNLSNDQTPIW